MGPGGGGQRAPGLGALPRGGVALGLVVAVGLSAPRWRVLRRTGTAGEVHGRDHFADAGRSVTFCSVVAPAVVLGSAEDAAHVDPARAAAAGVEVARRRSGGGAVLLAPGGVVWADVVVPTGDPLWAHDVGRATWWLGEAWAGALVALGAEPAAVEVHRGGLVRTAWSDRVCFAGLGPGEVRVRGRKVVGLSQRRTRAGAVFQCAVLLAWDPAPLVDVLALDDVARARAATELAGVAAGSGSEAADVEAALLDALARA